MLLMMGCGNSRQPAAEMTHEWDEAYDDSAAIDALSVEPAEVIEDGAERTIERRSAVQQRSNAGGYRPDTDNHHDDNMRGWDPASEDDMPDNGMSRYMENNDEEGWE